VYKRQPKQALLVETFFRHPGETLARKTLMEKVWNTDYIGDTRTLDVHIRWLRQAIEKDPGSPRYLLTVRGVGYRLEMPEALLSENDLSPLDASA
jgi:DNA-binding response OmpR family regulator